MKRAPLHQALLALAVALAAGACAKPPPALVPLPLDDARISALLERARASGAERHALRAAGRAKLDNGRRSGRVRSVIVAERPARLRFEALNLLGQTQLLLVTDGERFAFFDGKTLERGDAEASVLRRTLGLDFGAAEAVRALLAAPELASDPPREAFLLGADCVVGFASQRLSFDPAGQLRAVAALDELGAVRWRAEYADWRGTPAGRYPFRVSLRFPGRELGADLRFDEVELNPALEAGLFRVPEGAER